MKDPIVDEVRKIRKLHSEECNNDIEAIFNNIIEDQNKYSDRLISLRNETMNKKAYILSEKHAKYNTVPQQDTNKST